MACILLSVQPNMLRLLTKVLSADAHMYAAESGTQAIAALESEPIDVVLCAIVSGIDHGLAGVASGSSSRSRGRQFACPCHNGTFALDATRKGGPAPHSMDPLDVDGGGGALEARFVHFHTQIKQRVEVS